MYLTVCIQLKIYGINMVTTNEQNKQTEDKWVTPTLIMQCPRTLAAVVQQHFAATEW